MCYISQFKFNKPIRIIQTKQKYKIHALISPNICRGAWRESRSMHCVRNTKNQKKKEREGKED